MLRGVRRARVDERSWSDCYLWSVMCCTQRICVAVRMSWLYFMYCTPASISEATRAALLAACPRLQGNRRLQLVSHCRASIPA